MSDFFRIQYLKLRSLVRVIFGRDYVSNNYTEVESYNDRQIRDTNATWQDKSLPEAQWAIVNKQLFELKSGKETIEFSSFRASIECSFSSDATFTLLDIGCSSGYYSFVFMNAFPNGIYTGVDFSHEFIKFGQKKFPDARLQRMDANDLSPFQDKSFDCVVSGCVLLHIPTWEIALREAARVAKKTLILHRTPLNRNETKKFIKKAYGKPTIEWHFLKTDLVEKLANEGFELKESIILSNGGDKTVETLSFERLK